MGGIDYELLKAEHISFMLPDEFIEGYHGDYAAMRGRMIYDESWGITSYLKELQNYRPDSTI